MFCHVSCRVKQIQIVINIRSLLINKDNIDTKKHHDKTGEEELCVREVFSCLMNVLGNHPHWLPRSFLPSHQPEFEERWWEGGREEGGGGEREGGREGGGKEGEGEGGRGRGEKEGGREGRREGEEKRRQ